MERWNNDDAPPQKTGAHCFPYLINSAVCLASVSTYCVNMNWTISILCDFVLVVCLLLCSALEVAEEVCQTAVKQTMAEVRRRAALDASPSSPPLRATHSLT